MYLDKSILIIEDIQLNQKIISFWLMKNNYNFQFSTTGEEAIVFFSERWFDIVIMDIMLPGMSGFETTRKIREISDEKYKTQPFIVALTANTLDNDRLRCLKAGMDDYMEKPFDIQQLNHILGDHFKI